MIKINGFNFIEAMAVMLIIVILAAVALPSYQKYTLETRRSDAYVALMLAMAEQERAFAINNTYLSDIEQLGGALSPEGFYSMSVNLESDGYTVTAVPVAGGIQESDQGCQAISIDHLGVKLPEACW